MEKKKRAKKEISKEESERRRKLIMRRFNNPAEINRLVFGIIGVIIVGLVVLSIILLYFHQKNQQQNIDDINEIMLSPDEINIKGYIFSLSFYESLSLEQKEILVKTIERKLNIESDISKESIGNFEFSKSFINNLTNEQLRTLKEVLQD